MTRTTGRLAKGCQLGDTRVEPRPIIASIRAPWPSPDRSAHAPSDRLPAARRRRRRPRDPASREPTPAVPPATRVRAPSRRPSAEPHPASRPAEPTARAHRRAIADRRRLPVPGAHPDADRAAADAVAVAAGRRRSARRPAAVDPTGRFIVVLRSGTDPNTVVSRHTGRATASRPSGTFTQAFRGFTRDARRRRSAARSSPTRTSSRSSPTRSSDLTAQTIPTGVSRVGARISPVAKHRRRSTSGSTRTSRSSTPASPTHPDLNVAGGYNCSTSDRTTWRDANGHGTHVAGTVGALDNTIGVVGVAPGARVWAVRILNDDGYGLLSWYVCGLDWILAQRDPTTAAGR